MKKKMFTLLMAGMIVTTLVGCKAKTSSSADSAQTAATQTQPAKEDEQPTAEKQEEETVQLEDKEEKVDVVDHEEQTTEEVEIADNNEKKLDDLQDMLVNYKDRIERTRGSYSNIATLFRFSDINGDEYPELILMSEGAVITVLSYYNGDAWDTFDSSLHGGDWIASADEIRYNEGNSKIKAHKNIGNRYEENYVYEYVMGEYGPSFECIKYTTTLNDNYCVGTNPSQVMNVSRADYEKYINDINDDYEVSLSGRVSDGYFTIDEALDEYLN